MKLLMVGDIVGRPGRKAVRECIPKLKIGHGIDYVIANGENSSGGFGITRETALELMGYGIHAITTGNHVWSKKEAYELLDSLPCLMRPANYPEGSPGRGFCFLPDDLNPKLAVINLEGRVFMSPLECPFRTLDTIISELSRKVKIIVVDFHAEATSEKIALGYYSDGRVSALVGTHTHVQTSDERILPNGTAYITDLGMTGSSDSVIGVKKEIIIQKFLTQLPSRFEIASEKVEFCGAIIEIDDSTGKASSIERVRMSVD